MDAAIAQHFAQEWIAAWNRHDLEAILAHYSEEVVYRSPYMVTIGVDASGKLAGKDAVRAYFRRGLEVIPDLAFELRSVSVGVGSLVINYFSRSKDQNASELFVLDEAGLAVEVRCHYQE